MTRAVTALDISSSWTGYHAGRISNRNLTKGDGVEKLPRAIKSGAWT